MEIRFLTALEDFAKARAREYYSYGEATANLSTKIFIYLCQETGIELSPELAEGEYKVKRKARAKKEPKKKGVFEEKEKGISEVPKGMLKLEYENRFIMFLRKGNRSVREKTAKIAKQFIDTYVEEEEETE